MEQEKQDALHLEIEKTVRFLVQLASHLEASEMPGQAGNCMVRARALRGALASLDPATVRRWDF